MRLAPAGRNDNCIFSGRTAISVRSSPGGRSLRSSVPVAKTQRRHRRARRKQILASPRNVAANTLSGRSYSALRWSFLYQLAVAQ